MSYDCSVKVYCRQCSDYLQFEPTMTVTFYPSWDLRNWPQEFEYAGWVGDLDEPLCDNCAEELADEEYD